MNITIQTVLWGVCLYVSVQMVDYKTRFSPSHSRNPIHGVEEKWEQQQQQQQHNKEEVKYK